MIPQWPCSTQLRFVQLIVEHLTANGMMEVARLYESPFTDHAPHGPDMLFNNDDIEGIIVVLDQVRANAAPVPTVAYQCPSFMRTGLWTLACRRRGDRTSVRWLGPAGPSLGWSMRRSGPEQRPA